MPQPNREKPIVLGLRATRHQKKIIHEEARKRGCTMQAYFEEVIVYDMLSNPPALHGHVTVVIPEECRPLADRMLWLIKHHPRVARVLFSLLKAIIKENWNVS